MAQPQGYANPDHPTFMCHMKKSIYGLRQAPCAWYDKFTSQLVHLGFAISTSDQSLFIRHLDGTVTYLLLYVDDIILTGSNVGYINSLIVQLNRHFKMKDLGPLHYFLGVEVAHDHHGLFLSQTKYITDLLDRSDMIGYKPVSSLASSVKLSPSDGLPLTNPTNFRSIVGALLYVSLTRPDISFAVNQVCQYMHAPTDVHMAAVKRILRFLKGTITHGLHLHAGPLRLQAYYDADWAGSPYDQRSTNGYCVYLGPNPISWCAKKQSTVARSSTEAEYRCLVHTAAEITWLYALLREFHVPLPHTPLIWSDNVNAISLAFKPVFHAHTKHVEIDYHFVREKIACKQLDVRFVSSTDQIADIFTKGLSSHLVRFLQDKLCVRQRPLRLRERNGVIVVTAAVTRP